MANINEGLWKKAQKLAARDYRIDVTKDILSDGDEVFVVEHPELPGCMAYGNTLDEAIRELNQVRIDFIYYLIEDGLDIPEPSTTYTTTGTSKVEASAHFTMTTGMSIRLNDESTKENTKNGMDDIQKDRPIRFSVITESNLA